MTQRLFALAAFTALLSACPKPGVRCLEGQTACPDPAYRKGAPTTPVPDQVCADLQSDAQHCGACGNVCGAGFVCSEGACVCAPGMTPCGEQCVDLTANGDHCGSCDRACGTDQVCEASDCAVSCGGGRTQCGQACFDLLTSEAHCGACDNACTDATSCHEGTCEYDVVVACSTNGQLVGLQAGTDLLGPTRGVGPNRPLALAPYQDVVLVTDFDQVLSQARTTDLSELTTQVAVGQDARFIALHDPYVYVVNSMDGTLQIFELGEASADAGYALALKSELPLRQGGELNTYAQGVARIGTEVVVSVQGGWGSTDRAVERLIRVDVSDPTQPAIVGSVPFDTVDTRAFDGGVAMPRPGDVTVHRGSVYVALNNVEPGGTPAGPPLLAKLDPSGWSMSTLDLGRERCLFPIELVSDGDRLFVGCYGAVQYEWVHPYAAISSKGGGLVLVDGSDRPVASWEMTCDAGAVDCQVPVPSRFAVVGDDVYMGDQNYGRVFVLSVDGGTFVERRGFNTAQAPLTACPVNPTTQVSNAIDVVKVP